MSAVFLDREDVPLGERLSERGIVSMSMQFDSKYLFGVPETTRELESARCYYQPAMWELFHHLMGEIEMNGSIVSLSENQNVARAKERWGIMMNLINSAPTVGDQYEESSNLVMDYFRGELPLRNMSRWGYFFTQWLPRVQGENVDYTGLIDPKYDLTEVMDDVRKLVRLQASYPIDGGVRTLAELDFYRRFRQLAIREPGTAGGINIKLFRRDKLDKPDKSNLWPKMTNWRDQQRAILKYDSSSGQIVVPIAKNPTEQIRMEGRPNSIENWWNHTLRAMRLIIMHGLDESWLDAASFLKRKRELMRNAQGELSFEDFVESLAGGMPAFVTHQQLVEKMMEMLEMEPNNNGEIWLREILEEVEDELWEYPIGSGGLREDSGVIRHLFELAPLMAVVMPPVTKEELWRAIPSGQNREAVRAYSIGSAGIQNPQVASDAANVMTKWGRIVRSEGNEGLADILKQGSEEIRKWRGISD